MSALVIKPNEDRAALGIVMMLFAYFMFSFVDVSAKWLALAGYATLQVAFMRYVGHFVISVLLIGKGGLNLRRFASDQMGWVVLRGLLLMGSTVMNFFAVRYLPLTLTSTILFSSPVIICALSWPILGERVGIWRWGAIMLGFCGILVAIRPFDESFHWAVILSLGAATCFAMYSILTRKLAGQVPIDTMQFYSGAVGTFALLPFAIMEWQSPVSGFEWIIMLALGVFAWIGHEFLTRAHGYASASTLTPFGYSFILYLTVWSYLVFNSTPDQWTLMGAMIIIVAGMIIWFREKKPDHASTEPTSS